MRFIFILLVLFSFFTVFANGAAIDGSSLTRTGNIVYIQKENIKIEKESISIVFVNDVFKFNVKYRLQNASGKAEKIDYAFPVLFEDILENGYVSDDPEFKKDKIRNFSVKINGVAQKMKEQKIPRGESNNVYFVCSFDFPAKQSIEIEVNYEVDPWGDITEYGPYTLYWFRPRKTKYSMSNAKYFGSGSADELEINIDMSDLFRNGGKLLTLEPRIFSFDKAGTFKFKGKNFDFSKNSEIEIEYDNSLRNLWDQIVGSRLTTKNKIKSVKVSSAAAETKAANLFDGDPATAWCATGKNNWIEVKTEKSNIRFIAVLNGNMKNEKTLSENGKIQILEFEYKNCFKDLEKVEPPESSINILKARRESDPKYPNEYPEKEEIRQRYGIVYKEPIYFDYRTVYYPEKDTPSYENCTLRFKVKEILPGSKFKNVCISEIFILE
ncbi:hypothetical protein II898_04665 [bacterium]|nr:hypothetical protein [bacterium]